MNKLTILNLCFLSLLSCNNSNKNNEEIQKLLNQISELKKENKSLNDSLKSYTEDDLYRQQLIGISDETTLTIGKKNRIAFIFHKFEGDLPEYEIYRIENDKEIKVGTNKKRQFDYDFTPKSSTDNEVKLKVKIPYKNRTLEIPAHVIFKVNQ